MIKKESQIKLLKFCAFLIFIGRGYQYLFFDAPFRAFLWDESLLQPIVEGVFNTPWNDYATSLAIDQWIKRIVRLNGILFIVAAIASLVINTNKNIIYRIPILLGGWSLILLSLLSTKEVFYHYGQFFEHTIQFGVPFVLLYTLKKNSTLSRIDMLLKTIIALTFLSHGLYALGYYDVPGYFIDMVINSLGVAENTAVYILHIAGVLDILIAIFIFVPKITKYALWYAIFWGIATASARIVANFDVNFFTSSIHQFLYQVIYRIPHGLIPLSVLLLHYKIIKNKSPSHIPLL